MSNYEIREIKGADVVDVLPLMRELRPALGEESFLRLYKEAKMRDDYKLVGLVQADFCVALMGYRILFDFVHGKHLYIDDLVVEKDLRGQGLGKRLLDHALAEAAREECQGLRLCTGIENQAATKFYEREGWQARAVAFKIKL